MKEIHGGIDFFRKSGCFVFEFTILTIGLFLIVNPIAVSASLIPPPQQDVVDQDNDVCNTNACQETATRFLKNMNDKVDPCDNFYEYACGNFVQNTKLQDDEVMMSNFNTLMMEKQKKLKQSLSSAINKQDYKALKLLKMVYQSCMDTEKIEKLGLTEMTDKIKSMGGWPVVDGDVWNESGFNWLNVVRKSQQFGLKRNFLYSIDEVPKSPALEIRRPSFYISSEYLESNPKYPIDAAYLKFITAIAEAFGAKKDPDTKKQMSEVWQFMKDLQKIPMSSNNEVKSISQLSTDYPSIPWREYINSQKPENIVISENTTISANMPFVVGLESLLARTPKRIIANYAITEVVLSALPYLNDALQVHSNDFWSHITGATKSNERWQRCIGQVETNLPIAVSSVYIREHLTREDSPINDVRDIYRHLKETLGEIIEQNNWMDPRSKVYALAKVQAMRNRIGYPKDLLEDKKVDEYYKELQLSKNLYFKDLISNAKKPPVNKVNGKALQKLGSKIQDAVAKLDENNEGLELPEGSYFDIMARIRKFNLHKQMAKFGKIPDDNDDWEIFAIAAGLVNAFYVMTGNEIIIPAAAMRGNFFNKDRPQYVNYGSLGMVVGHEISHGFGPEYINVDKNGNTLYWLTPFSKTFYNLRKKCIADQYFGYQVKDAGMTIDENSTLDESFSDLVGITTAYSAYKKWVDEYQKEQKLPGIDRSPEQLFWLSVANTWCTKQRPLSLQNQLATKASHPPEEARIVLSLRNNPQFAKDFNCKLGSYMNPGPKCIVF